MASTDMRDVLLRQRSSFAASRPEPLSVRRDRIERVIALLKENGEALCSAMAADFGGRSRDQGMLIDIGSSVAFGKYCLKHIGAWSRPEKRKVPFPLNLLGAKAEVRFEPKGVIGIMAPWNLPVQLCFTPLVQILAAGNRAMIKPSEITERTSDLIADLVDRNFAIEEIAVFLGGPDVAHTFTQLPLDHLVFTGSTATGRRVMKAAAENLVPLTLELGGKSPVIVGRSANFAAACDRIVQGKMMNAGQACVAPDYLLVPKEREADIVRGLQKSAADLYPAQMTNDDYASIVSDRHYERVRSIIGDAFDKGATVIEVDEKNGGKSGKNSRRIPLTLLSGVVDDMTVMQEEIFAPVLPIVPYSHIDEAIDFVSKRDNPLALYYFGYDKVECERVLARTSSGGVTVNDVIFHVAMDELPFGGVGASGMGSYHGIEGFREFSHARSVYRQPKIDISKLGGYRPPYGKAAQQAVGRMLK